ncbi:putative trans-sialidase, Group II [Trypanosoma cruzi]|uniref:Trans-sialidase, putative n=2 Tax=Trypanosoma cruzi TaxID=5693 RepID=Q4DI36_TRYCC|nr:trans-sialidase, putative [Trypanosoma cruzi]EAN92187.1 trans-sialidase, putative [Trypanosoma cruzi]PWV04076.1 putative trans-sialidase, Group II [Trypanosoma cruzi]RNC34841.1 trans-sialidase-like protein [Trypanosoma cruzi]|eukprot:XP_814038.1 trans-sialidase [Trypanosoma cruzi strain CL Brener]
MLSRVAAVEAPRTHNRRCVTGSRGRRREGRESEPQRPNMSRLVFTSAVLLLLFVVVMFCGSGGAAATEKANAGKNDLINIQNLQRVDLFVSRTTLVLPKKGTGPIKTRDSFFGPSLVSAGGVIAAFAEGHMNAEYQGGQSNKPSSSDVVAEYIDSAWNWSTLVGKVSESTWKAHTVLGTTDGTDNRVGVVLRPTTTMKDNKVFLLAGSTDAHKEGPEWKVDSLDLKLVVGDVTNSTSSKQSGRIEWGDPRPLFDSKYSLNHKSKLNTFFPSGGSGVLMEDGTLVFSLMAESKENDGVYSMIIYSTNNGSTWSLSEGVSSAGCHNPRITEWGTGSLLMVVDCVNGQRVYESRDMGTTWTEATGTLPGVWVNARSVFWDVSPHLDALITATIEGRKVMLYTQREYTSGKNKVSALYLWVTDNNRTFCVGPVAVEDNMNWMLASSLLYSDGYLHILQRRVSGEGSAISLSRLTEELKEIESVLSTWSQKDVFFFGLSIPMAGLVAVLSDAASGDTWNDEYLCLNATVTNATKVKDGFQLTEPDSGVMWPVNTRGDKVRHVSLSHNFTLVASVTIEETPSGNTPLLTAVLLDAGPPYIMRLSYTADNKWVTIFKYEKITKSDTWESGKEYQVALMLQGNKASVYIDGKLLGEEEALSTDERPIDVADFCFGACDFGDDDEEEASTKKIGKKPRVTVKNVFLYNRPLNSTEMTAIKERIPVLARGSEWQADDVPQTIASAGSAAPGPGEVPAAPGRTTVERATNAEHASAISFTSAGSGLLPLLLLLGLWVFAAL